MKCPFCGYDNTKVIDSRPSEENISIRRRRQCEKCNKRFTTYEKVETIPLMVIKKDKTREPFNRDKLMDGILRSCHKRPVSVTDVERLVEDIENKVLNSMAKEIDSVQIGEYVMEGLKGIDEIAYVRFASVYRQFKDINTFMQELNKMIKGS
ncbi:transcriptional regulator NrdR [Vallitalea okinawensis]|uniref:transcriptional regulator NrdR n=1 Tax=Vallitalea okinawensis TaxID=2078660 RepID=UPI000CFD9438|nr:transcriptional regulator NrdR [Vallitalea okinawensis]